MTRTICVVTGSRAEYGLLRWLMQGVADSKKLRLQVVVTGMHLSEKFGSTYREIENDGFSIARMVDIELTSDAPAAIASSMGLGVSGFGEALSELRPDVMVVLGDRFEILSAVSAALVSRTPVAHLHGGELTEGAFDDAIRHAITKMSHLHFVAAEEYRKRVIQLGEDPERVFLVGGLGIDNIRKLTLLEREEMEKKLGFKFGKKNLLVTFHPATLDEDSSADQIDQLLGALETLLDTEIIFTMPNADTSGRAVFDRIENFTASRANAHAFTSLGQVMYLSCLREVDAVVGNSSSGLTEAPSFGKPTVNIGDRQGGRIKAESVIDCAPDKNAILSALAEIETPEFRRKLKAVKNPYGDGGASAKIVKVLETTSLDGILKKRFHDIAS